MPWMDTYAWALTVIEMFAGKRFWEKGADSEYICSQIDPALKPDLQALEPDLPALQSDLQALKPDLPALKANLPASLFSLLKRCLLDNLQTQFL